MQLNPVLVRTHELEPYMVSCLEKHVHQIMFSKTLQYWDSGFWPLLNLMSEDASTKTRASLHGT